MSISTSSPIVLPHLHKGFQLPYFKAGSDSPNSLSADDMNKIIHVLNALMRGEIMVGTKALLHISDHKFVWEIPRGQVGASTVPPGASNSSGTNGTINDAEFMGDGRVLIGGTFTRVNGLYRERNAVIENDLSTNEVYFGGMTVASGGNQLLAVSYVNNPPDPSNGDPLSSFWTIGNFTKIGDVTLTYGGIATADETGDPGGFGLTGGIGGGSFPANLGGYDILGIQLEAGSGNDSLGMVCGQYDAINGTATSFATLINKDGTVNGTFDIVGGAFAGQTVGTAYVANIWQRRSVGYGNSYPGNADFYMSTRQLTSSIFSKTNVGVIRVDGVGALDSSFQPFWDDAAVFDLHPYKTGIVALANADSYHRMLFHMNPDGTLVDDLSDVNYPTDGPATTFAVDSANRMVLGGQFNNWTADDGSTSVARVNLARVHSDGKLDYDFDVPVTGTSAEIKKVLIDPTNDVIFIFGTFESVGGKDRFNMARITSAGEVL